MTVGVAELISFASHAYTLYPGDIIMTGTPEGVGPVAPGDVMVAECENIGKMTVAVRRTHGSLPRNQELPVLLLAISRAQASDMLLYGPRRRSRPCSLEGVGRSCAPLVGRPGVLEG